MAELFDTIYLNDEATYITSSSDVISFTDANGTISTSQLTLTGITLAQVNAAITSAETFATAADVVNLSVAKTYSLGIVTGNTTAFNPTTVTASSTIQGTTLTATAINGLNLHGTDGLNYHINVSGGTFVITSY